MLNKQQQFSCIITSERKEDIPIFDYLPDSCAVPSIANPSPLLFLAVTSKCFLQSLWHEILATENVSVSKEKREERREKGNRCEPLDRIEIREEIAMQQTSFM